MAKKQNAPAVAGPTAKSAIDKARKDGAKMVDVKFVDPFCAVPTLSLTCTIAETGTKEAYNRDPRGIAQRGEKFLQSTGLADAAVFGPEAEFFIFDNVQFDTKSNGTFYAIDSDEGVWNTGRDEVPGNL